MHVSLLDGPAQLSPTLSASFRTPLPAVSISLSLQLKDGHDYKVASQRRASQRGKIEVLKLNVFYTFSEFLLVF